VIRLQSLVRAVRRRLRFIVTINPVSLTAGSAVLAITLFAFHFPILDLIELQTYDLRIVSRGARTPSPAVVLLAIDEKSLDTHGRWPWPRSRVAEVVERVSRDGAKVIAFDVGFPETDEAAPENDEDLARAIAASSAKVVLGYFFHMSARELGYDVDDLEVARRFQGIAGSQYPIVLLPPGQRDESIVPRAYAPETNLPRLTRAADGSGFFSLRQDVDGVVRWMPLVIQGEDELFPPLSIAAVWQYLDEPPLVVRFGRYGVAGIQIGERFVPTDDAGRLLINYYGPSRTFPHLSIGAVLDGTVPAGTFRDRIVIVAATATGLYDVRSTPFGAVFAGAEIHASVIDDVLSGEFVERPGWAMAFDVLAIVILATLVGVVVPRVHALPALLFAAGLFVAYIAVARELFVLQGIWVNLVYPLLSLATSYTALTAYHYVSEQAERRKIHGAFGRYVAPAVIEHMLKDPARLTLGGEEKFMTVLFSDLVGFSAYSERYSPQELFALLSQYYARMTERIFACDGMLSDYIGDELMATFGAPLELTDHAARACAAALEMAEHRRALNEEWLAIGRPRLAARTGINSGIMLVGNLGTEYRFCYGVLGDHVNLASRLEGLNKQYKTDILISDSTAALVGNAFRLREVDLVRVVGKQQPTGIYELLAANGTSFCDEREAALRSYAAGFAAYCEQRWREAAQLFAEALQYWPDDGPSRVMIDRCRIYEETAPDDGWDGVFTAIHK
jgi:adenylate cyclase